MADAEKLMNLFDFYWFRHHVITNATSSPPPPSNPDLEIFKYPQKPDLLPVRSRRHSRSLSDQFTSQTSFSSDSSDSSSPKSVLMDYNTNPIVSSGEEAKIEVLQNPKARKQRRGRNKSKSLSELEFEELKGFMDLGFVFSAEDRNSRLASIIPGLQRLGKKEETEEEEEEEEDGEETNNAVSRPYLSEAWSVVRREEKPMMNWRFPSLCDEIDMKDHLRCWAHSVAAAVR